jgi:hypothetical protein
VTRHIATYYMRYISMCLILASAYVNGSTFDHYIVGVKRTHLCLWEGLFFCFALCNSFPWKSKDILSFGNVIRCQQ